MGWGLMVGTLTSPSLLTTRLTAPLPTGGALPAAGMALSPDGQTLVAAVGDQLYRRALDSLEAVPIPGTENAVAPFFSPDGTEIGFMSGGTLRKVSLEGRPAVTLAEGGDFAGATWGPDNTVVYSSGDALWQVSGNGGAPTAVADRDPGRAYAWRWPELLPDGATILVTEVSNSLELGDSQVVLVSLEAGESEPLMAGSFARWSPSGHVVYWREGALWAVPFDLGQRRLRGTAIPVVENVESHFQGLAQFALSATGTLAYRPGSMVGGFSDQGVGTVVWVDRTGSEEPLPGLTPHRMVGVSSSTKPTAMCGCMTWRLRLNSS